MTKVETFLMTVPCTFQGKSSDLAYNNKY